MRAAVQAEAVNASCATCGDTRVARYEDKPTPGTIGGEGTGLIVCTDCSVIVSKSDAEEIAALREIKRKRLAARNYNGKWEVGVSWGQEDYEGEWVNEPSGYGKSLSKALAAYRKAAANG